MNKHLFRSALAAAVISGVVLAPVASALAAPGEPELSYAVSIGDVQTGTAPFDATAGAGHDTSPTDNILRSHDTVAWDVAVSVNSLTGASNDATNATITYVLPDGLAWNALPAQCLSPAGGTPSGVSADGKTATCNLGDIKLGSSPVITFSANALSQPDGTTLAFAPDAISFATDDPTTPAVSTSPGPLTITSAPRLNMTKVKSPYTASNVLGPDGVTRGWNIQYGVTITIPEMSTKGLRGYQTPDQPITFVDDLSGISPNAQLVSVKGSDITNHAEFPLFSRNSDAADAVTNGGAWKAVKDPANPQKVTVTITSADLTGNHLPTKSRGGSVLADNKGYLSLGYVVVFVPMSDVPGYATGAGILQTSNVVSDLEANGFDANGKIVANVGEDTSDNTVPVKLTISNQGAMSKRFTDIINNPSRTPYLPLGTTSDRSGDGPLVAGQQVQSYLAIQNGSAATAFSGVKACDIWDSTVLNLAQFRTAPSGGWAWPAGSEGQPAYARGNNLAGHFEYLTGFTLSQDQDTRWGQMQAFNCADSAGVWTDQATALANPSFDLSQVVAVRFIADAGAKIAAGQNNVVFLINLERTQNVPSGQIIANMAGWSSPDLGGGTYRGNDFDPAANIERSTASHNPTTGDRMIAVDAAISVTKSANKARIAAGAAGSFTLNPKVLDLGVQGSDTATSVTLTDTIPAGLTFLPTADTVEGEATAAPSQEPSSVVVNADGSTTVTWEFDSITRGQEPTVTYWARAALTARGDYVNTVAVSSPSDGTSPAPGDVPALAGDRHMAQSTVSVDGVAGIAVSKIALNPVIAAGEDFSWRVDVANGSTVTPQTGASVIDVLPFLGDGSAGSTSRVPATSNEAEYRLTGPVSLPAGATAQYTTDDAETVQLSQTLGSGQGSTYGAGVTWQDFAAVADQLAMVTGIKVTFATMPPLSNTHFTYTLTHVTGSEGGIWANNATFRTVEAPLGVLSNTVTTTMVPGPVSIDLVKSASAPANGVSYVAGETIDYGFVVTNTGSRELHDVTLSESNFVNGAGEALELTTPIAATQPADFDGTLAPGVSVTYSASYDVTVADQMAGGEIANTADVSGTPNAGDAVTDESTASVNVDKAEPGIELVKSVANAPADGVAFTPGEQIDYNFTVRNTGNVPLSNVTVDEGSFTNGNGAELKLDGGPTAPEGFDGTLTPGQQVVFTGTYTVTTADASGTLLNVATASGETPAGITPGQVTDTAKVSTTVAGPEAAAVIGHTTADQLTLTGANSGLGVAVLALLLVLFGAVLLRPTKLMKRLRSRTER